MRVYMMNASNTLRNQRFGMDIGRLYGYFNVYENGAFIDPLSGGTVPDYDPSAQPWYTAALDAGGDVGMTQVFDSQQLHGEAIAFTRRILDAKGDPLGVVALDVPFGQLRNHISELRFSNATDKSYGFLMNENLEVIAHPNTDAEGTSIRELPKQNDEFEEILHQLQRELIPGSPPVEYSLTDHQDAYVVAYSVCLSNGWILTLATPVFEYYNELIRMEVLLLLLAAILALILIFMLIRLDESAAERDAQLRKLAAVTQNYKGVVWSSDNNGILTTLRGQYIEKLGQNPEDLEGKHIVAVKMLLRIDFNEYAERVFTEGPLNWTYRSGGRTFHSYMAPVFDQKGNPAGLVGSVDDVSEPMLLNQKLEEALEAAEIANKAKSSFLANMSHEIRTPMNAILGITEILVQNENLPEDIMEGLTKIYNSCGLLLGIINDVLDFSKIEAGKLDITPAHYQIASLINDSVQLNIMRIGSKPIEFRLHIDAETPAQLIGDEIRIKQILNNLLSNAFKYTEAGTVTLKVGFEQNDADSVMLILSVQDTGVGMTNAQIEKLFDEYSRFMQETSRTIEGTGLGMAITQRLVHLMNGDIRLESAPGKGTLFIVALPQAIADNEVVGEEVAESLRSFKLHLLSNNKRVKINRDPMPYGSVLVVDDVETNIYVAIGLLKLYGIKTDSAMSGYEAIEKLKAGQVYDIIFMDHMMPGMDGIETVKQIRDIGYNEPIVALTANAVAKQADIFLQNGFNDFIAKPIDIRQLNAVLNHLVRDKQPPEVIEEARRQHISKPAEETGLDAMIISSFIRDARKALTILQDPEADMQRFTITAHGMKSALANIGEAALSARAKELEFAGQAGDVSRVKKDTPSFLNDLSALLEKYAHPEAETDKDTSMLREKLALIAEMCEDYDRKGATDIIAELNEGRCSRPTRQALDKIMEAVLHSEFEEAAEIAAQYANSLPLSVKDASVDGLDITRGLNRYEGDEDTYLKILRSYVSSLTRLLAASELPNAETLQDYTIAVHGIKGASRDIFADEAGDMAARLEDAAKAGDFDYIGLHHPAFVEAAGKLAADITGLLKHTDTDESKPVKDIPDAEALAKLRAAAEVYNMDGVDEAMKEIEAYRYNADEGLLVWLRERVDAVDFAAIIEKI
jgi:signal transduction histidine kinase/DNA-binding response OmpR family regulator